MRIFVSNVLFLAGIALCGCNLSTASCKNNGGESCSDYNSMLPRCQTETMLPGCHVEKQCTDYSDAGDDSDAGDSGASSIVCKNVCVGDLLPCEDMPEKQCRSAEHCTWDENSI
jgi:hypothetical protein